MQFIFYNTVIQFQTRTAPMTQFSFAKSIIATTPAPQPEEEAIRHMLPPQPILPRPNHKKDNPQNLPLFPQNNQNDFVNITLGNSPEFHQGFQPRRPTQNISNFNRRMGDQIPKKYLMIKKQSQIEVTIVPKQKEFVRSNNNTFSHPASNDKNFQLKDSPHKKQFSGSREAKDGSGLNQQSFQSQKNRNPREEKLFAGEEVKKRFTNRNGVKNVINEPDRNSYINKIEELKNNWAEAQEKKKTLNAQLQISREKIKTYQSDNSILKQKFIKMQDNFREAETNLKSMGRQVNELRKLNDHFCEEIDKQKEEIIKHEEKNQQSIKLLQKLNQNTTKREEKMKKQQEELTQVIQKFQSDISHIETERDQIQAELTTANEQIKQIQHSHQELSNCNQQLQSSIQQLQDSKKQLQNKLTTAEETIDWQNIQFQKERGENKRQELLLLQQIQNHNLEKEKLQLLLDDKDKQKDNLLKEVKAKQNQIEELNTVISEKIQQIQAIYKDKEEENVKLTESYEGIIKELKKKIDQKENEVEHLVYANKELQMKMEVALQQNQQNLVEIKDLKEEKKIIYIEKEELKNDVKHLLHKNDTLFQQVEQGKHKEMELNQEISKAQQEIIQLQQRISQNITQIGNKQFQNTKLSQRIEQELQVSSQLNQKIKMGNKSINDLQDKLKKNEKLLLNYKQGLDKIKKNNQVKLQQMKQIYEAQIQEIQAKLKQFSDKDSRRNKVHLPIRINRQAQHSLQQSRPEEQSLAVQPINQPQNMRQARQLLHTFVQQNIQNAAQ